MLRVFNMYWQKNMNHVVDSILPINNLFYLAAEWTVSVWELTVQYLSLTILEKE